MSKKARQQNALIEKATLDYFLRSYNQYKGTHLQFKCCQESPDYIARNLSTNEDIGIEVTVLYDNNFEARFLLGRSNDAGGLRSSTETIARLNNLLKKKAQQAKKYEFEGKLVLVIRVASRVFDKADFDMHEADIIVPTNRFAEIWLVLYDVSKQAYSDLKCLKP